MGGKIMPKWWFTTLPSVRFSFSFIGHQKMGDAVQQGM